MATLLYHPAFLEHETKGGHASSADLPPEYASDAHVERPDRLRAILALLEETGLRKAAKMREPPRVDVEALTRVHPREHVETVRRVAQEGGGRLDPDTVASPGTYEAALRAAGGAVEAARLALGGERAFSLARPPGHHATADRAMGFCFFNSAAVAAQWALDHGGCERVLVFDHDVHHGNGTQDVFYERSDVCYVSIHQSPLYPGTGQVQQVGEGDGEGFTVNVPVPAGVGDAGYREALERVVLPVIGEHDPDLLIVSAGFDTHHRDPLGGLKLTSGFFGEMTGALLEACPAAAFVLEGGYDLQGLSRGVASEIGVLTGVDAPAWEESPGDAREGVPTLELATVVHGRYWEL